MNVGRALSSIICMAGVHHGILYVIRVDIDLYSLYNPYKG